MTDAWLMLVNSLLTTLLAIHVSLCVLLSTALRITSVPITLSPSLVDIIVVLLLLLSLVESNINEISAFTPSLFSVTTHVVLKSLPSIT